MAFGRVPAEMRDISSILIVRWPSTAVKRLLRRTAVVERAAQWETQRLSGSSCRGVWEELSWWLPGNHTGQSAARRAMENRPVNIGAYGSSRAVSREFPQMSPGILAGRFES